MACTSAPFSVSIDHFGKLDSSLFNFDCKCLSDSVPQFFILWYKGRLGQGISLSH